MNQKRIIGILNWAENVQAVDFSFLTTFSSERGDSDSDNVNEQGKTAPTSLKFMQEKALSLTIWQIG